MLKSQQIVADGVTELKLQGKAQKEIAYVAGFQSANIIAMIKSGSLKIALERAPDLEKALELTKHSGQRIAAGGARKQFIRLCMRCIEHQLVISRTADHKNVT